MEMTREQCLCPLEYVKKNYEEWIKMTPKEQLVITKKIYRGEIKP